MPTREFLSTILYAAETEQYPQNKALILFRNESIKNAHSANPRERRMLKLSYP